MLHFQAQDQYWIGSADMMHRNLDRRVEVLAQVKDPRLSSQLGQMLDSAMDPATRCWTLRPDGNWQAQPDPDVPGAEIRDHQEYMMRLRRPDRQ